MQKHKPKLVALLAIVSAAVLAICTGLASASGPSTTRPVHLYEADTNPAADAGGPGTAAGTVVLTGAITDYGTDEHGANGINTLDFGPNGSFKVDASAAENKLGRVPNDLTTCSYNATVNAPIPIVPGSGTGNYTGITGTFAGAVSEADVYPRFPDGTCHADETLMHGVLIANGSGSVSYTPNH
jgi:hypothetical protein